MSKPLPALDTLDPAVEWSARKPSDAQPWDARTASHLYRRGAFGPTRDDLKDALAQGMEATVDRLLSVPKEPRQRPPAVSGAPPVNQMTGMPDATGQAAVLRATWLQRLIDGVEPAREKLALFWHNHFATSIKKVNDGPLMEQQGELLFKHALGSFRQMLREISRDPAMLMWLDSNQNVKGKPNENYAREVMELFTLGVGNYTEKDVQEGARAFTGWHTNGKSFTFVKAQHDHGEKTFLGQKGDWDGDDVLRVLLDQPICATFIMRKLYRFLVNESVTPPDAFLAPLADAFRKSDYDITAPVRTILRSKHFYSAHALRQKVKWPVEYAVGMVRMIGVGVTGRITVNPYSLLGVLELMGQQLYAPPNVKGWEAGRAWLNTATVLARHNFAHSLVNGMGDLNEYAKRFNLQTFFPAVNPLAFVLRLGIKEPAKIVDFYSELLLPGEVRPEVRTKLIAHIGDIDPETEGFAQRCRDALFVLLTLPEYQLN
ncbi:MAG TPA: DUF1800 domain-containing protein [Gemmataceae bacterium]|jgi:uncharacterized protein (DUF1800 family)|nr:DUF1800 domain-containing protein [Gemmataceae bacterium]